MTTIRKTARYGWKPGLPDRRDRYMLHAPSAVASRPASVDLSVGMVPCYDQANAGSCTGNMAAAAFEFNLIKQGLPVWTPSRRFAYYNARLVEGTTDQDAGAEIRDVVKGLATYGVVPENEWQYHDDLASITAKPTDQVYADAKKNVVREYLAVEQTVDDVCTTLAGGEPVCIGFSVYTAFEGNDVARTGVLNLPTASETPVGGHAVLIMGYDDATARFKVRNSWGTGWGQNGYFFAPYSYFCSPSLASDLWVIRFVT